MASSTTQADTKEIQKDRSLNFNNDVTTNIKRAIFDADRLTEETEATKQRLDEVKVNINSKYYAQRTEIKNVFRRLREALAAKEQSTLNEINAKQEEELDIISDTLNGLTDFLADTMNEIEKAYCLLKLSGVTQQIVNDNISALFTLKDKFPSSYNYTPVEIRLERR